MIRPRRRLALASAVAAAVLLALRGAPAEAAARASAQRVDVDGFWLTVSNLDRSVAFYRDVVGMAVQRGDAGAATALLRSLTAMPGARVRSATLRSDGGPTLRLLEFGAVPHRLQHPHSVDPGAALLEVRVPDLAGALAAAARARMRVVTRGGTPVSLPDGTRSVVLLDPDGFFVALSQSPLPRPTPPAAGRDAAQSAPLTLRMRYTVAEPRTMVHFYHETFGVTLHPGSFGSAGPWMRLLDEPGAQWAITRAVSNGAGAQAPNLADVQFVAFRAVMRHTYSGRPQDPGTSILSLRVSNLPAALRSIHSAGLRVLSAGGQPVALPQGGNAVLFRDPAGVLVELTQP